jgi:hypothetical protein
MKNAYLEEFLESSILYFLPPIADVMSALRSGTPCKILWHVDPLRGNDRYWTVARKQQQNKGDLCGVRAEML